MSESPALSRRPANWMVWAFQDYRATIFILSWMVIAASTSLLIILLRLIFVISRPRPTKRPQTPRESTGHLLVVLGSGGHTAEMLNILSTIPDLTTKFGHRTYLVSSGDGFSASKAKDFEDQLDNGNTYSVISVRRARRVHQSFLTAPVSALLSLWDCIQALRSQYSISNHGYPDIIITNGPGTGVCVVFASVILLFFSFHDTSSVGQMRTIFVESWARVNTLSLSGRILKPFVNRFLVQWPQLAEKQGDSVNYMGTLVS